MSTVPAASDPDKIGPASLRSRARSSFRRAAVVCVLAGLARLLFGGIGDVELKLTIQSWAGADGEVFYSADGEPHSASRRLQFAIEPDGAKRDYRIRLPAGDWRKVRIDPGSKPGEVRLHRVAVRVGRRRVQLKGHALVEALGASQQMRWRGEGIVNGIGFDAEPGGDPWLEVGLPAGATQLPAWRAWSQSVWRGCWVGFAYLILDILLLALVERLRRMEWVDKITVCVDRVAELLSDEGVLVVTRAQMTVLLFGVAVIGGYLVLSLHQSSIEMWEGKYPARDVTQLVELGSPRGIRSDEWAVGSPWILGQVARGEPIENPSVGAEEAPLVAGVPVSHWSRIASVEYYGFSLFGAERGFSWLWAYRTFGVFLSTLWMLLVLTKGNLAASLLGSAWLYVSPFTQWWLSSILPNTLIAFALAVVGTIYWVNARRIAWIWLGAALAAYALVQLVMHLYPPFAMPLAYLGIAILAGVLAEAWQRRAETAHRKQRIIALGIGIAAVALFVGTFVHDTFETMVLMTKTVYPGHRRVLMGSFSLPRTFYGFFDWFRFGEASVPMPPSNSCEASNFVLLAPVILCVVAPQAFTQRRNALLTTLAGYFAFLGCWVLGWLPLPVAEVAASLGFGFTTSGRAFVGLGAGSIVLLTVALSRVQRRQVSVLGHDARTVLLLGVALVVAQLGFGLQALDAEFFTSRVIWSGALIAVLFTAGVAFGRVEPWAVAIGVLAIPGLSVNPLVSGTSSLLEKPVFVEARRVGGSPGDRWVVFSHDFTLSQGLKAQGLTVLTGSQLVPNPTVAAVLDPARSFEDVWNRYANVVFLPSSSGSLPTFRLAQADFYRVELSVCGSELRALGVNRVAFEGDPPESAMRCLRPLPSVADSGIKFFELSATFDTDQVSPP